MLLEIELAHEFVKHSGADILIPNFQEQSFGGVLPYKIGR